MSAATIGILRFRAKVNVPGMPVNKIRKMNMAEPIKNRVNNTPRRILIPVEVSVSARSTARAVRSSLTFFTESPKNNSYEHCGSQYSENTADWNLIRHPNSTADDIANDD